MSISHGKNCPLTKFECLSLIFYFLVEINADLFIHRSLYIIAVGMLLVSFFNHISLNIIRNRSFVQWAVPWIIMTMFSILYSVGLSQTVTAVFTIGARLFVMLLLIQRCNNSSVFLLDYIKLFIITQIINTLYILSIVDLSILGHTQLGRSIDERWNSNSIGIGLAYTVFAIFVILYHNVLKSKFEKTIFFLCMVLFVTVILLTGSRKALFIFVVSILMFYLLSSDLNSILPRIMLVILILIVIWWLIMNIEALYRVLGVRVERLLYSLLGDSNVNDISVNTRKRLIEYGAMWIKEKPILGYGMNTFEIKYGNATGQYWYSHNNYIEVTEGTGIIGAITYYWVFIRFIKRSLKKSFQNWRIVLALSLVILINDYGTVSYKMFIVQMCILCMLVMIEATEDRCKEETKNA